MIPKNKEENIKHLSNNSVYSNHFSAHSIHINMCICWFLILQKKPRSESEMKSSSCFYILFYILYNIYDFDWLNLIARTYIKIYVCIKYFNQIYSTLHFLIILVFLRERIKHVKISYVTWFKRISVMIKSINYVVEKYQVIENWSIRFIGMAVKNLVECKLNFKKLSA